MKAGRSEVEGYIGISRPDWDTGDTVSTQEEQQTKTKGTDLQIFSGRKTILTE